MRLFGCALFRGSLNDFLETVETSSFQGCQVVVTPNVDHLRQLSSDPAIAKVYWEADHFLIDGMPLLFLSRVLGGRGFDKISGADLFPFLLNLASRCGRRVGILGGFDSQHITARLSAQFPLLDLVVYSPSKNFSADGHEAEEAASFFKKRHVDMVFACVGMPKQERWAMHHRHSCGANWIFCVGGALDFVTGAQRRAPAIASTLGAEWLWRMADSPRRLWRRYLAGLVWIGPAFARESMKYLFKRSR